LLSGKEGFGDVERRGVLTSYPREKNRNLLYCDGGTYVVNKGRVLRHRKEPPMVPRRKKTG